MDNKISNKQLVEYQSYLAEEEKRTATIEKYTRDIRAFLAFTDGQLITKKLVISFKEKLKEEYAPASVNSMLAAVNQFLQYLGLESCCVKQLKIQKQTFCDEKKVLTKAEYERLLEAAKESKDQRLFLLLQTICATGIRVSELQFITVQAVENRKAMVDNKGKNRVVFLPERLCRALTAHIKKTHLKEGSVFITKTGKAMDRSNIWREMKQLCEKAGVDPDKVFPHNLRHLFAHCYYTVYRDIVKLADILGHNSIETTRIYMASTGQEHRIQMEQLDLTYQGH